MFEDYQEVFVHSCPEQGSENMQFIVNVASPPLTSLAGHLSLCTVNHSRLFHCFVWYIYQCFFCCQWVYVCLVQYTWRQTLTSSNQPHPIPYPFERQTATCQKLLFYFAELPLFLYFFPSFFLFLSLSFSFFVFLSLFFLFLSFFFSFFLFALSVIFININ